MTENTEHEIELGTIEMGNRCGRYVEYGLHTVTDHRALDKEDISEFTIFFVPFLPESFIVKTEKVKNSPSEG
jgi:kynurenine formamidase